MRHYHPFPGAIPQYGAGRSRITHPFATLTPSKLGDPVRLACVKHAASVHPEPESNPPQKNIAENPKQTLNKKSTKPFNKEKGFAQKNHAPIQPLPGNPTPTNKQADTRQGTHWQSKDNKEAVQTHS